MLAGALVGGFVLWQTGAWERIRTISFSDVIARIRALGPGVFFLALAVLPALGVPVTPFYLVASRSFGLPLALAGCLAAIAGNTALSYGLARSVMHPVVAWLVERAGRRVPQVRPRDRWMVALLLRITPGPPFFIQSYVLALGGIPFRIYMIVSLAVAWLYGTALIIFGETLLSGSVQKAILGLAIVVAVVIIVRLVRARLQARAAALLPPDAVGPASGDAASDT